MQGKFPTSCTTSHTLRMCIETTTGWMAVCSTRELSPAGGPRYMMGTPSRAVCLTVGKSSPLWDSSDFSTIKRIRSPEGALTENEEKRACNGLERRKGHMWPMHISSSWDTDVTSPFNPALCCSYLETTPSGSGRWWVVMRCQKSYHNHANPALRPMNHSTALDITPQDLYPTLLFIPDWTMCGVELT